LLNVAFLAVFHLSLSLDSPRLDNGPRRGTGTSVRVWDPLLNLADAGRKFGPCLRVFDWGGRNHVVMGFEFRTADAHCLSFVEVLAQNWKYSVISTTMSRSPPAEPRSWWRPKSRKPDDIEPHWPGHGQPSTDQIPPKNKSLSRYVTDL
jgi:hypothetical protein